RRVCSSTPSSPPQASPVRSLGGFAPPWSCGAGGASAVPGAVSGGAQPCAAPPGAAAAGGCGSQDCGGGAGADGAAGSSHDGAEGPCAGGDDQGVLVTGAAGAAGLPVLGGAYGLAAPCCCASPHPPEASDCVWAGCEGSCEAAPGSASRFSCADTATDGAPR